MINNIYKKQNKMINVKNILDLIKYIINYKNHIKKRNNLREKTELT